MQIANADSCKYWLEQGADIELKSIQETKNSPFWAFSSNHLIFFRKGKSYVGQEKTFETLLNFYSKEHLSKNNITWEHTAKILLNQFEEIQARQTIRMIVQKGADFSIDWFKSDLHAAKFIEEYSSYDSIKYLNEWTNNGKTNHKLIQSVFREATLNGKHEMCQQLIEAGYSPKDFVESQAFNNIREGGTLIEKKSSYMKEQIEKTRKVVDTLSLREELNNSLELNTSQIRKSIKL